MTGAEFGEVDIDVLADYIGGALAGTPDESAVAALIADDPAWRTTYASLRDGMTIVATALGDLGSAPMPADVAARLDAALTSPIARPAPIDPELAAPPVPHLALVRGDVGGLSHDQDRRGDDGDARGPDPVPVKAAVPRRGPRRRWAAPIAVAAGLIAFVGFGVDYLAGQSNSQTSGSADRAAGSAVNGADRVPDAGAAQPYAAKPQRTLASGTDYTATTLAREPVQPLTAPNLISSAPQKPTAWSAKTTPLEGRLNSPEALRECLAAIEEENAGGSISVESVDYARFDGAPAVIVRFTAANGRWAWASGPACGTPAAGAATLGKVPVR